MLWLKRPEIKISKKERFDVREANELCSVKIGHTKEYIKQFETKK